MSNSDDYYPFSAREFRKGFLLAILLLAGVFGLVLAEQYVFSLSSKVVVHEGILKDVKYDKSGTAVYFNDGYVSHLYGGNIEGLIIGEKYQIWYYQLDPQNKHIDLT